MHPNQDLYARRSYNKVLLKRALRRILRIKNNSCNMQILHGVVDEGICPMDFKSLQFTKSKSWCDDSKYDPRMEPYELCKHCWCEALRIGEDENGFKED